MGNIVNRVFDSSGPEGKVRGTPQQIIEKYQVLARDAQLSNDRVAYENFLQHSEHYTRMLGEATREMQREADDRRDSNGNPARQNNGFDQGSSAYPDDDGEADGFGEQPRMQAQTLQGQGGQSRDYPSREPQPGRDQSQRDPRDQPSRDQSPRDQLSRDQQARGQQPREQQPREQQRDPRDQQPRDQQSRDQLPRDPHLPEQTARDPHPREQTARDQQKRDMPKRELSPRPATAPRPIISSMMPDLTALGATFEDDGDSDTGLVETPEMKPEEKLVAKPATRRRPAPRKAKPDAADATAEPAADTSDKAAE